MNHVLFVTRELQQISVEVYFVKYVSDDAIWNVLFGYTANMMDVICVPTSKGHENITGECKYQFTPILMHLVNY